MTHTRWLVIVLLAALVLRLAPINQPLWFDEAYTADLARMPLGEMLSATHEDVHGPLWYLIAGASVRLFGMSEIALRIPSLVLGMLAVWLTYRLARELFGAQIGLVASAIMAINPLAVYHSGESRMYSLLLCGVLVASWGSVTGKRWAVGLGMALTLFSHNLGFIYLPGIALLAGRARIRRVLPAMALGCLPYALWVPSLVYQLSHNQFSGPYWISYFSGNPFASMLSAILQLWFPHFTYEPVVRVGALVAFALLLFPSVAAFRVRNLTALALVSAIMIPPMAEFAASIVFQPIILSRTLIATLPAWSMLIAWWVRLPRAWNWHKAGLVGLAACTVFSSNIALCSYGRAQFMQRMLDAYNTMSQPGDIVCHTSPSTQVWFKFYKPEPSKMITTVDPDTCKFIVYSKSVLPDSNILIADGVLERHTHEALITAMSQGDMLIALYQVH